MAQVWVASLDKMIATLKSFLSEQENVKFAYLFGSQVDGSAHAFSDVDIAVYYENDSLDNQLELNHQLHKLLDKEIDTVNLNTAKNMHLLENILLANRCVKYHEAMDMFEINVWHAIEDFKAFNRAINAV